MKTYSVILCLLLFSITFSAFGQKISETSFAFGISKTLSSEFSQLWVEATQSYQTFNASRCWYGEDHRVSLRKEMGLNLQYSDIGLEGAGLGVQSFTSGNIISLFADVALLTQIRINRSISFGLGPEAEFLLIGNYNLKDSWSSHYSNPPSSGKNIETGTNRKYFSQPAFGLKARIFESGVSEKVNIGIAFSYLWTKRELSNFYASNYARISFYIGFKKQKKEIPPDPLN
jgi:hypothetical protein